MTGMRYRHRRSRSPDLLGKHNDVPTLSKLYDLRIVFGEMLANDASSTGERFNQFHSLLDTHSIIFTSSPLSLAILATLFSNNAMY